MMPRKQFGMMSDDLIAAMDAEARARTAAAPDQRRVTRREVAEEKLRPLYELPSAPPRARRGVRVPEAPQTATDNSRLRPAAVVAETPAMARQRKLNEARRSNTKKGKS